MLNRPKATVDEKDFYKAQFCKNTYIDEKDSYKTKDEWGDYIVGIQAGLSIVNRFDEGLNTASFRFPSSSAAPIPQWTKCRIWCENDFTDWWVQECRVELAVPGKTKYYWKNVQLIELTKVLQTQTLRNLVFSRNVDGTSNYTIRGVLQRIIDQMFPVLYETDSNGNVLPQYKKQIPIAIEIDGNIPRLDEEAPEFFFTETTVFEAFLRVGEYIGGMPELLPRNTATGKYVLTYKMWENDNRTRMTFSDLQDYSETASFENYAEIVESSVRNMLASNDEETNTLTYPCEGAYKGINAAEYETTIPGEELSGEELSTGDIKFTLPFPVYKILKVESKSFRKGLAAVETLNTVNPDNTTPYNGNILEADIWRTVPPSNIFEGRLVGQDNYSYYVYDSPVLEIKNLKKALERLNAGGILSKSIRLRVTYIPIQPAKIQILKENKASETDLKLPIKQIVNQSANIVQGQAYSDYLQGLVNRLIGEYKVCQITQVRGAAYPEIGDIVNGEIVVESKHVYYCNYTVTIFTTSKEFNRRSQFVDIPQEIRQWQIPADGKVADTEFHYMDKIQMSLNESIENAGNDSAISAAVAYEMVSPKAELASSQKVKLAYIAWKSQQEQDSDANLQNANYALAAVNIFPLRNNLIFNWNAADNASMGVRSYHANAANTMSWSANRQTYISYNEKAEILRFKFSDSVPISYNFENDFTGTGTEGDDYNKAFDFTFPMSNKQQYLQANTVINFSGNRYFRIQKDLRERIMFFYQLCYEGVNGTKIGDVYLKSLLYNSGKTIGGMSVQVVLQGDTKWVNALTETKITGRPRFKFGNNTFEMSFKGKGETDHIDYDKLKIVDDKGNLIFQTDKSGSIYAEGEINDGGNSFLLFFVKVYFNFTKNYLQPM